jgi:hypothetical protein
VNSYPARPDEQRLNYKEGHPDCHHRAMEMMQVIETVKFGEENNIGFIKTPSDKHHDQDKKQADAPVRDSLRLFHCSRFRL